MKVILLATQTADGYIARDSGHLSTDWSSPSDKRLFVSLTKKAGVLIMGHTTFATFGKALPERRLIILSRQRRDPVEGVEFTSEAPEQLLRRLESEGVKQVVIGGGTQIYNQYMEQGLITELYLSMQPVLFGRGLGLFSQSLEVKLELLDSQVDAGDGTVINHYSVAK